MLKKIINKKTQTKTLYNNILLLCRNKLFYTKFDLIDTFQNRINLIFVHISFIFIKFKQNSELKKFQQELFDLIFKKIEVNMREIGFGDTTINKNMKFLVKNFYNILLECEKYKKMNFSNKSNFLRDSFKSNNLNNTDNKGIIDYFNKYEAFCFDLSLDSVLSGELKFNYK